MKRYQKNKKSIITILAIGMILNGSQVVKALDEDINLEKNINILSVNSIYDENIKYEIMKQIETIKIESRNSIFITNLNNIYKQDKYEYTEEEKMNMISANIVDINENKTVFNPYIIKEIDGIKIGVIGIYKDMDDEIVNLENIKFEDEILSINKYSEELKEQGVNNIIVSTNIPAPTNDITNGLVDIEGNIDVYDIQNKLDSEVDVIISDSNLNNISSNLTIENESSTLEVIKSNPDEDNMVNLNIGIDEENNILKINEVEFFKVERNYEDEIIIEQNENNKENNYIENEEINIDENKEVINQSIKPRVVGGTDQTKPPTTNNDNTTNKNDNSSKDEDEDEDEDDKAEKEDLDKKDDTNKDKKDNNSSKDEDEDEDEDEDKDEDKDKNNNSKKSLNPKTGDSSIGMYIGISLASILGLNINRKYKNK